MWHIPLTHGIAFSVATGCALFLFGLSVGLVLAGLSWVLIAVSENREGEPSPTSSATISDEEIETVIELVRDALAGDGWTLCGDCYSRQLLRQVPFPVRAWEPCSTHRADRGTHAMSNMAAHIAEPTRQKIDLAAGSGRAK